MTAEQCRHPQQSQPKHPRRAAAGPVQAGTMAGPPPLLRRPARQSRNNSTTSAQDKGPLSYIQMKGNEVLCLLRPGPQTNIQLCHHHTVNVSSCQCSSQGLCLRGHSEERAFL